MTTHVFLNSAGLICSLGSGPEHIQDRLFSENTEITYLKHSPKFSTDNNLLLGVVEQPLAAVSIAEEDTRNNRMLTTASEPLLSEIQLLKERFGPQRIAAVIGTSTSGISDGEEAMRYHKNQNKLPTKLPLSYARTFFPVSLYC